MRHRNCALYSCCILVDMGCWEIKKIWRDLRNGKGTKVFSARFYLESTEKLWKFKQLNRYTRERATPMRFLHEFECTWMIGHVWKTEYNSVVRFFPSHTYYNLDTTHIFSNTIQMVIISYSSSIEIEHGTEVKRKNIEETNSRRKLADFRLFSMFL